MAVPLAAAAAGGFALNFIGKLFDEGLKWLSHFVIGEIDRYQLKKEIEVTNAMALQFEKDKYKAQVEGMHAAGINPAITSAFSMGWTARN